MKAIYALALTACFGAHRVGDRPDAGASGDDALTCGAATCDQAPPSTCIDALTLRTFPATCTNNACSYPEADLVCGNTGCCTDHCCALEPSNADVFGTIEITGLTLAPPNGTFDTDAQCTAVSALGSCQTATRGIGVGDACICRSDNLTIDSLQITGSHALVLLVSNTVTITGKLDVSARAGVDGPGASRASVTHPTYLLGGPGGSYGTSGGASNATPADEAYGTASLVPLYGGMTGAPNSSSLGGGGGGALQITAGHSITVSGIVASGGGGGGRGLSSYANAGASGGGSGGGILLEAPTVSVTGSVGANGGGGGGGGADTANGYAGGDATVSARAGGGPSIQGGGCPLYGYVQSGTGGAGARAMLAANSGGSGAYSSACSGSPSYGGNGGGGGGLGRIRINTITGCDCSTGTFSPVASVGSLGEH